MTNEQKAKKIANKAMNNEDYARHLCCSGCKNYECYTKQEQCLTLKDLLTMAQWKDEQFEQEKQKLIDNLSEVLSAHMHGGEIDEVLAELDEKMKGE